MKFLFFDDDRLGVLAEDRIADIDHLVSGGTSQERLVDLITRYDDLRPELEQLVGAADGPTLGEVRVRPPVPSPTQLLCAIGNYNDPRSQGVIDFFLKSPLTIIGDGDTVELPEVPARVFHHEAELAVVIGKAGRDVSPEQAAEHIFGYTGFIDISARDIGASYYQKKSFATFGPMGPVIVTRDEIEDPQAVDVLLTVNGEPRQDFTTDKMEAPVGALVAAASSISGLAVGDVVATGTYHIGMGPVVDGDEVSLTIAGIGSLGVKVTGPATGAGSRPRESRESQEVPA